MKSSSRAVLTMAALSALVFATDAAATTVQFGRITAARQVDLANPGAQTAGTLIGGALGVASGSGQSRSNRALRGVGGAAVGGRVGAAAGSSTGFEYTVLIGAQTVRIVTDTGGLRVGDCVSLQRGAVNNIRLEPDERCEGPVSQPSDEDVTRAYACEAATQQLIAANTDAEFDRAERRVRLLCE